MAGGGAARRTGTAAAAVLIAVLDWFLWTAPVDVSALASAGREAAGTGQGQRSALAERPVPGIGGAEEIVARPLFSAGRRPAAAVGSPSGPEPSADTDIVLAGVMLAGNRRHALLAAGSGERAEWVEEGSEFAGWRIAKVEAASILLEANGTRLALDLRRPDAAADGSGEVRTP